MRDVFFEYIWWCGEEWESNEEIEWKGDKVDCEYFEYILNWCGEWVDEGCVLSFFWVGDKV